MATPDEILQAAVASRLGPDTAAAQAQQTAQPAQPAQPAQGQQPAAQTPEDAAQTAASPETEGDQSQKTPVIYDVDFGEGNTRRLTPEQIKATFQRYTALNSKHQGMKPVLDAVEKMISEGATPEQIAASLAQRQGNDNPSAPTDTGARPADTKVPGEGENESGADFVRAIKQWETDNAVTAPPGYAQAAQRMMEMEQAIVLMAQSLGALQQAAQSGLGASQSVADAAQSDQQAAVAQRIGANLDAAQNRLGLDGGEAQNFMTFAAERGYTLEDFIDPQLTLTVMQDFQNASNSGEFTRLKEAHARRAAYTEVPANSPAANGVAPQLSEADQRFQRMTDKAMVGRV